MTIEKGIFNEIIINSKIVSKNPKISHIKVKIIVKTFHFTIYQVWRATWSNYVHISSKDYGVDTHPIFDPSVPGKSYNHH